MGSLFTSDKLEITVPALPRVRRTLKSELEMCLSDEDGANNKRKSDGFSSCDMTLKELKERSRKKKKLRESAGLTMPNIGNDSCHDTKQDDANAVIKIEESEIEMPLSVWKRKVSNKAKQNCTRKKLRSSTDPGVAVAAVTEPIHGGHEDSSYSVNITQDPPKAVNEIVQLECSEFQTIAYSVSDDSAPEALADDSENSISSSSMNGSSGCVLNEASFEYPNHEPISHPLSATLSLKETTDGGSPQVINEFPPFSVSELPKVDDDASQTYEKSYPAREDLGSDVVSRKGYTFRLKTSSCKAERNVSNQVPDIVFRATLSAEDLSCGGSSCGTGVKSEDDSSFDTATLNCNIIDNSENLHMSSMVPPSLTDAHITPCSPLVENQSVCASNGPQSSSADGVAECVPMISPIARSELTATEVFKSEHVVRADSVPRKLFSTRKAISPTSQEKLRHSMDVEELNDSIGNPKSSPEGSKISIGKVHGRSKKNISGSPQLAPKGILKASPSSAGSPHECTETSYIPSRAQKAVAFSQRQMLDIESLAGKLMNELKSMKDIVEERLCYNELSSTPKYTSDEMRNALQNVAEVEETTKRWLSMMARDCNRFCKIMRSTGKTSSASAERKKIVFADEAGGLLCQVKILEDSPDSGNLPESESVQ
ncbi:hypothetical protein ACHQM5_022956 [Ranunculus cassubicifolius]